MPIAVAAAQLGHRMTMRHPSDRAIGVRLAKGPRTGPGLFGGTRTVPAQRRRTGGPDTGGRRLLVVEDDDATGRALQEMLELEGYLVRHVRSGADAIDTLHDFTPDAVTVDLQLPVMDGRSFIELYRRRVRPAASVIVISGRSDGRAIANTPGAEGYVPKPLEMDQLLRTLSVALAVA